MNNDIFQTSEKLVKKYSSKFSALSIFVREASVDTLELLNNDIETFNSSEHKRVLVKVVIGKKLGLLSSNLLSDDTIKKAAKIARSTKPLEYFHGFPGKQHYIKQKCLDKNVINLHAEDYVKMAKSLIKNSGALGLSQGAISTEISKSAIFNSDGVNAINKETDFSAYVSCIAKKAGKVSSYYDAKQSRGIFDLKDLANNVSITTKKFLNTKLLKKNQKELPLIIRPRAMAGLLKYSFLSNLNGKNVEKKRSILCDSLGKQVVGKNLTLIDDGLMKKGVNTTVFDGEGTSRKKTALIEKGLLSNYIYDHNTAIENEAKPTGNATLSDMNFSNLLFKSRFKHVESEIDEAIIVDTVIGAHTSNPLTTAFGVQAEHMYLLKKGRLYPVSGCMFSGKMIDILQGINSIDKEVEQRSGVYVGNCLIDNSKFKMS